VARGPLPNAGSMFDLEKAHGSAIATPAATVDAAQMLVATVTATWGPTHQAMAGKARIPRTTPRESPVNNSRRITPPTGMPTESPLTTSVSVWVPTASAM